MNIDLTPYSLIVLNLSGGKDSHVMACNIVELARRQKVEHRIMAVHSDTGAEWTQTRNMVETLCHCLKIPLKVVSPVVSIPDYIEQRGKFPSMQCRFCTSIKTGAIDKLIRHLCPFRNEAMILSVTGERREESRYRAKLVEYEPHKLTAGNRKVFHYRPILDWKESQIWDAVRQSEIAPHPAYTEFGNERLSCALCVFACDRDLRNGARNRPDLAERYLQIEQKTGFLFRAKKSLRDILYPQKNDSTGLSTF